MTFFENNRVIFAVLTSLFENIEYVNIENRCHIAYLTSICNLRLDCMPMINRISTIIIENNLIKHDDNNNNLTI
jgi:hypothetical protein